MQLIIVPFLSNFLSHNMFRLYTAIIGCLKVAKTVALYGMSKFSYNM
jgi:hypothetical protein